MRPAESEAARDARRFGMDAAALADIARATAKDEHEGLWPEHEEIGRAFLTVCTQWRAVARHPMEDRAGPLFIGLDYTAVRAGLEAAGFVITPDLWDGVRIMEFAACAALNGIEE